MRGITKNDVAISGLKKEEMENTQGQFVSLLGFYLFNIGSFVMFCVFYYLPVEALKCYKNTI